MKILVTGAGGFIGSHLVKRLLQDKHQVIAIDRKSPKIKGLKFQKIDVLESKKISPLVQKSAIVFHLAALTTHQEIVEQPLKTLQTNLQGTLNVLESFSKGEGKIFIYPSTGKVYGKIKYLPIDEDHPSQPTTILGATKKLTEELIRTFSVIYPQKTFIILRIFNIYGPGQRKNFLITTILAQQKSGSSITLGDIKAKRDYLYIDDLIAAFEIAAGIRQKGLHLYNVGSGVATSAEKIVRVIDQIKNQKTKIIIDRSRFRQGEFYEERTKSGLKKFGWQPKYSLTQGIRKTLQYQV